MSTEVTTFELYDYQPNRGAAVFFTIIFSIVTLVQAYLLFGAFQTQNINSVQKYTNLKLCSYTKLSLFYIPLVLGGVCEVIGFITRSISVFSKGNLNSFIAQRVCILIAPNLFMTTMYLIFGKLVQLINISNHFIFSETVNRRLFVTGNIAGSILQGVGGGISSDGTHADYEKGKKLIIAGLAIQLGIFVIFSLREFFLFKIIKNDGSNIALSTQKWKLMNLVLLASGILIMVRSIVRLVEVIEGSSSPILRHEWFSYVFDTMLMFLLMGMYAVTTPFCSLFHIQTETINFLQEDDYE